MKHLMPATLLLAVTAAFAQPPEGPPPGGERRGPPPEALAACKTAKAGADCSFAQGERTTKGSCWAPRASPWPVARKTCRRRPRAAPRHRPRNAEAR